jgi:hypothetical protein
MGKFEMALRRELQTDTYIYIATERLVPLRWHVSRQSITPETAKWGLYSIAVRIWTCGSRFRAP